MVRFIERGGGSPVLRPSYDGAMLQNALRTAACLAACAGILSGCGASASVTVAGDKTPSVPRKQLEVNARKQLSAAVGRQAPPITCPGNLDATVGATLRCSTQLSSGTYAVTLTVTSVKGTDVRYDVQVAKHPS